MPYTLACYTTSMFVTVMLTLADRLDATTLLTSYTPIAFTFFDGVRTITRHAPLFDIHIQVATGAAGQITAWNVAALDPFSSNGIRTANLAGAVQDAARSSFVDFAFINNAPGTSATVGSVADTGFTLSLMALTFMALGVSGPAVQARSGLTAPGLAEVASSFASGPASRFQNAVSFSLACTFSRSRKANRASCASASVTAQDDSYTRVAH